MNIETNSENPHPVYPTNLEQIIDTGIDVGSYATPQLIDLNRDGLLDLVVGERSGIDNGVYNVINYFENTGLSNQIPIFIESTPEFPNLVNGITVKSLGGINLMDPVFTTAYTTPHVFEYENEYHLAIGTENGKIFAVKLRTLPFIATSSELSWLESKKPNYTYTPKHNQHVKNGNRVIQPIPRKENLPLHG